jgi:hypothetical protein
MSMSRRMRAWLLALDGALTILICKPAPAAPGQPTDKALAGLNSPAVADAQWTEYQADVPKTIVALQPFRLTTTVEFQTAGDHGTATLVDLSPRINSWFLLTLHWAGTDKTLSYHLENPSPKTQRLALSQAHPLGLEISAAAGPVNCALWQDPQAAVLEQARASDLPYAPLCGARLFLRNRVAGSYTHLERVTNFLRDDVWGGDRIVGFVKREFYTDAFMEKGGDKTLSHPPPVTTASAQEPPSPKIDAAFAATLVLTHNLGIEVDHGAGALLMGRWYAVRDAAGIFLSVIQPQAASVPTATGKKSTVTRLDEVEAVAVDYLVAMDLADFDLGFALGTDHPRVGWSARTLDAVRDAKLPGPDGIGSVAPLVVNGIVNPTLVGRVAATFAGGFKREHGAFHYGPLSLQNHGTHYGFVEQGVIFSKLQPQLATLMVDDAGDVRMLTWTAEDSPLIPQIKFARQNGVPLIDYDARTGTSAPGAWVNNWGAGNWSGSEDEHLRSLRAGVCLLVTSTARYLVFGYFSTATPSAMARVFEAYGCRYAMHLDMNALEHTYFALYAHKNGRIVVEHLIEGMAEVDRKGGEDLAPRFLSFPDDRDFFYLTRKQDGP